MYLDRNARAAIDGLIADATDFPDARHFLADIMEDCNTGLAVRLRLSASLPVLWECCRYGSSDARRAAAFCRQLVAEYARLVYERRADGTESPEVRNRFTLPVWWPYTAREMENNPRYARAVLRVGNCPAGAVWSYSHCLRLVQRGVAGLDVPPDVQVGLMDCVECCREALRDLGTVVLSKEGGL